MKMSEERTSCRVVPENWLGPLRWESVFSHAERPIEVDVGCGKGRFLLARARRHPEINFLGIERLLGRLRKVDRKAVRAGLDNVRLLRAEAYYATMYLLPTNSITTFYLLFPDPWPKTRHHDHRLFNSNYVSALARTLVPGGALHVATDHEPYFAEIKEVIRRDGRFEAIPPFIPEEEERTDFEIAFLGKRPVFRCSFRRLFSFDVGLGTGRM